MFATRKIEGFLTFEEQKEACAPISIQEEDYLREISELDVSSPENLPCKEIYKNLIRLTQNDPNDHINLAKRQALQQWSGLLLFLAYRSLSKNQSNPFTISPANIIPKTDIDQTIHFFAMIHDHLEEKLGFTMPELYETFSSLTMAAAPDPELSLKIYLIESLNLFSDAHALLANIFIQANDLIQLPLNGLEWLQRCADIHLGTFKQLERIIISLKENATHEYAHFYLKPFEEDLSKWYDGIAKALLLTAIPQHVKDTSSDPLSKKLIGVQDLTMFLENNRPRSTVATIPPTEKTTLYPHEIHGFLTLSERTTYTISGVALENEISVSRQIYNAHQNLAIKLEECRAFYQRLVALPTDDIEKRRLLQQWGSRYLIAEYGNLLNQTLTAQAPLYQLKEHVLANAKMDLRKCTHFLAVLCEYVDVSLNFSKSEFYDLLITASTKYRMLLLGYFYDKKLQLSLAQQLLAIIFEQSQDSLILKRCADIYFSSLNKFKKKMDETYFSPAHPQLNLISLEEESKKLQTILDEKTSTYVSKKKKRRNRVAPVASTQPLAENQPSQSTQIEIHSFITAEERMRLAKKTISRKDYNNLLNFLSLIDTASENCPIGKETCLYHYRNAFGIRDEMDRKTKVYLISSTLLMFHLTLAIGSLTLSRVAWPENLIPPFFKRHHNNPVALEELFAAFSDHLTDMLAFSINQLMIFPYNKEKLEVYVRQIKRSVGVTLKSDNVLADKAPISMFLWEARRYLGMMQSILDKLVKIKPQTDPTLLISIEKFKTHVESYNQLVINLQSQAKVKPGLYHYLSFAFVQPEADKKKSRADEEKEVSKLLEEMGEKPSAAPLTGIKNKPAIVKETPKNNTPIRPNHQEVPPNPSIPPLLQTVPPTPLTDDTVSENLMVEQAKTEHKIQKHIQFWRENNKAIINKLVKAGDGEKLFYYLKKQTRSEVVTLVERQYNFGRLIQFAQENPCIKLSKEMLEEIKHNLLQAKTTCLEQVKASGEQSNKYQARLGWLTKWEDNCEKMLQEFTSSAGETVPIPGKRV